MIRYSNLKGAPNSWSGKLLVEVLSLAAGSSSSLSSTSKYFYFHNQFYILHVIGGTKS